MIQGGRIFGVGGVQGGGVADLAGEPPPQGGGGQFVGQRMLGRGIDHQVGQVGATGCGLGEMGGQLWPEAVAADAGVDGVDELTESCDRGASATDRVHRGVVQEPPDGARPCRVLVGADEAAVLGRYSVRGTEHGDFGGQFGCRPDEGFGPCGCGGRCPGACGGANLVGQFGDEIGATMQVLTPLRILAESVGYGGQPAQRADAGRMAAGGVDAPIEHSGRVAGVVEPAFGDGLR